MIKKKLCTGCNRELPITEEYFYRDKSKKDGFVTRCKDCRKLYMAQLYQKNKEEYRKASSIYAKNHRDKRNEIWRRYYNKHKNEINKKRKIKREENREVYNIYALRGRIKKYNMTIDDYYNILNIQKGRCAICGTKDSFRNGEKFICIDHDHKYKKDGIMKIRGLLCSKCNSLLGLSNDNPLILIKAVEYLRMKEVYIFE